jgi:uncharacterized protein YaaQ
MAGKMIMCIVHHEDSEGLTRVLNQAGYRVTRSASTGGFLRQGKVSLMIGVDESQVDDVLNLIRENTHARSRGGWWARPGKHKEGAATVFVLDMEQVTPPSQE